MKAVENAIVLTATRRMIRPAAAPLGTIRSLGYFSPDYAGGPSNGGLLAAFAAIRTRDPG